MSGPLSARGRRLGAELWTWLAVAGSVVLLLVLAVLQFRWLEQVAEADRQRTTAALDNAVARLADDFNAELSSLLSELRGVPVRPVEHPESLAQHLSDGLRRFEERSDWPRLVRAAYLLVPPHPWLGDGSRSAVEGSRPAALWTAYRLDIQTGTSARVELTPALEAALRRLGVPETALSGRTAPHGRRPSGEPEAGDPVRGPPAAIAGFGPERLAAAAPRREIDLLVPEVPGLTLPIPLVPTFFVREKESGSAGSTAGGGREASAPERRESRPGRRFRGEARGQEKGREELGTEGSRGVARAAPGERGGRRSWGGRRHPFGHPRNPFAAFVFLQLDRGTVFESLLPELVARHFGAEPEVSLEVLAQPSSEGEPAGKVGSPVEDAPASLFAAGPPAPGSAVEVGAPIFGPLRLATGERGRSQRWLEALGSFGGLDRGRWRLVARHPAGSLHAAVSRTQHRNLAVALGILAVLGTAMALLAAGYRRSRHLARQQLEFVAGITHELMTPVAAVRSAGQNLADGVVREPEQLVRYGRMIDREGRRLADRIQQVLAFARMQSGEPRLDPRPLDAEAEVRAVHRELLPVLEAEGVELEVIVKGEPPRVAADPEASRRCLSNLVVNAIKYGQPARGSGEAGKGWVGLEVCGEGGGVCFRVRDRGSGIDPRDRAHIFEPFYRGRGLAASQVPGSGLGLALVRHLIRAQGGRIHLESEAGKGTVVSLWLPAAEESR